MIPVDRDRRQGSLPVSSTSARGAGRRGAQWVLTRSSRVISPSMVPDIVWRVGPPSRPLAMSRPPMSNPRTSRRGSRPSSVAPAATFRRIGSGRIVPARAQVHPPLRQCQDQILYLEIFPRHPQAGPAGKVAGNPRQFQVTRRRLEVDRNRGIGRDGSAGRKDRREGGASLTAKGQIPGSDEGAHPAFLRRHAQPQPIDRKYSLGHGHAEPGVRQRQVFDVEQAGERSQVRWPFRLPGARALEHDPPRFQVPQPRPAVEEAARDQFELQVVQAHEIAIARRTRDHESGKHDGRRGERYFQACQGSRSAPSESAPSAPRAGPGQAGRPPRLRSMRRLPEGSPIPRHTRGPFVSGSPISSGDKGPIAILRVKHFSPRHKIFGGDRFR